MDLIGEYTGAAVIFGATGGVMEAALRTVADILEEQGPAEVRIQGSPRRRRRHQGSRTGRSAACKVRVAVAHSTAAARKLLDAIRAGTAPQYHFIEIMGCSGGCVCGGGQPQVHAQDLMDIDLRTLRAKALYEEDTHHAGTQVAQECRCRTLYKNFLGEPNGHLSHELLHTHYHQREIYPDSILEK